MQMIIMTSDNAHHCLLPFVYLLNKYFYCPDLNIVVCGFAMPSMLPEMNFYGNFQFHSMGDFENYPANKWSDAFLKVLDEVAQEQFILMLEDYWITRAVDIRAIRMLFDYAKQFRNVLKIDLAFDRLFMDSGSRFLYGYNTYDHVNYLDLVKSPRGSQYQMSLWGGIWNRDIMQRFIIPGERAQEIEMRGTARVNEAGDEVLVLGTRQGPLLHGNIYQSGRDGPVYNDGGWKVNDTDLQFMREKGWVE